MIILLQVLDRDPELGQVLLIIKSPILVGGGVGKLAGQADPDGACSGDGGLGRRAPVGLFWRVAR